MTDGHHGNISGVPPAPTEESRSEARLEGGAPPASQDDSEEPASSGGAASSQPASTEHGSAPKPLLASEALIEDLAPVEPWAGAARGWMAVCGVAFALVGLSPILGAPVDNPAPSIVLGGLTLAGAVAPVGYLPRGALALVVGLSVALLGMVGIGPAAVVGSSHGAMAALHFVTAVGVSAALLFRARYRAYAGARYVLTVALAASLPFVGYALVTLGQAAMAVQITTGVALAALAISLLGFMGSETTVAGAWVAAAVIAGVSAELGCEALVGPGETLPAALVVLYTLLSTAAFAGAALLGSLGTFMLLAARHWRRARHVDIRGHNTDPPESLTDTWSTRK